MSGRVLRACLRRVNQLAKSRTRAIPLRALDPTRRQAFCRALASFRAGGMYLLRNMATDKGARVCVRLVRRILGTKGRMLCLLPRVTLAARVARQLQEVFNGHLKMCRSGFPSTRQIRV